MRNKILIIICILLNTSIVYSQTRDSNEDYVDRRDSIVKKIGSTADPLYWKGESYLIDRSFLSVLDGYKDIYPDIKGYGCILVIPGGMGYPHNDKYYAYWLLKDDILYLRALNFFHGDIDNDPQRYKTMEQFTKRKFRKSKDPDFAKLNPKESAAGSMKASWVNGVFYIKKAKPCYKEGEIEDWYDAPYHKVTFKKGKLISDEVIKPNNKPRKSSSE